MHSLLSKTICKSFQSGKITMCCGLQNVCTIMNCHAFCVKLIFDISELGNCTRFQMQTGQMITQVQPTAQEPFLVNPVSYNTSYNLALASLNIPRPMHSNLYVHKNWINPSNGNTRTLPDANKVLFKCEHCSKAYRFPSLLKAHYLKHTQEKQLACRFCGKPFKWEYSLRRHERMYCGKF